MAPLGYPLIEDNPGQVPTPWVGLSGSATAAGSGLGAEVRIDPVNEGEHNTHLWVAGVMIFSLVFLVVLQVTGFRFSTDVGITRR